MEGRSTVLPRLSVGGSVAMTGRYHSHGQREFTDDYTYVYRDEGGRVLHVLGHGMNGDVFLCKSKTKEARYAVKPFRFGTMKKSRLKSMRNECEILLAMDHPNVGRLVDVYENAEQLLLVMEYMQGGTVFQRIAKKERFDSAVAQSTVRQMMQAVNYIHGQGVVHRDIKDKNFVYARESDDEVKLIDFGISAKVRRNRALHTSCGTIRCMAPEVLNGRYDQQCDLWSMGVVTFTLLSGYMPFEGGTSFMAERIKSGRYEWKEDKWRGVPEVAQDFVKRLLVVSPSERLTAAEALGHPWLASSDAPPSPPRTWFDKQDLEALQAFHKASHFKKVALRAMAWSLTLDERHELCEKFLAVDKDQQGTISFSEFKAALKDTLEIEDAYLNELLFTSLTGVGDCESVDVRYSDFLAAMCTTRVDLHDALLLDTFKRFDADNCGTISLEDLTQILGDQAEAAKALEIGDANGDGRIDLEEFVSLIKEPKAPDVMESLSRVVDRELTRSKTQISSRSVRVKSGDFRCKSAPAMLAQEVRLKQKPKLVGCCSCFAGCFGGK